MLLPVLLNLCLATLKFVGGKLSGSLSVTADALNNLTDTVTSFVTMLGLKVAAMIGGKKHENGHGRMEWIVAMAVSGTVVLVGWETLKSAIDAIREPADTEFHVFTLCVLLASIGVKLFLYGYNTKKSREKNSQALKAAAADCISDAVATSVVAASLLANVLLKLRLDGWCGLLVALFILYNGVKSFADTAHRIVGGNSNTETKEKLRQYVLDFGSGIFTDVPELQVHDYGYDRYGVSLCVSAGQDRDALEVAECAASLRFAIYRDFGFPTIIQTELPVEEAEAARVRQKLRMAMQRLPFRVEAEQIRVIRSKGQTQVILVAELSFEDRKKEAEIAAVLQSLLSADRYELIVKLRLGRSQSMNDARRLHWREKQNARENKH